MSSFDTPVDYIPAADAPETSQTMDGTFVPLRKYEPSEMSQLFAFMYEHRVWGNDRSTEYVGSSGPGSYKLYNFEYTQFIKRFIQEHQIGLINDLGCGTSLSNPDIYNDSNVVYNGYDIYPPIVEFNNGHCTRYNTRFAVLDFYNDRDKIPFSDLVILKDVFSYWSNECINTLLTHLIEKKLCKYILITNCCYQELDNLDASLGTFRPLNSTMSPLKDFGAVSLFKYRTKEVSLIDLSHLFMY